MRRMVKFGGDFAQSFVVDAASDVMGRKSPFSRPSLGGAMGSMAYIAVKEKVMSAPQFDTRTKMEVHANLNYMNTSSQVGLNSRDEMRKFY